MRSICFYFQVHQPMRLKNYRFFNIGEDHDYFDDHNNAEIMRKVARKNYLPMNTAVRLKLVFQFRVRPSTSLKPMLPMCWIVLNVWRLRARSNF